MRCDFFNDRCDAKWGRATGTTGEMGRGAAFAQLASVLHTLAARSWDTARDGRIDARMAEITPSFPSSLPPLRDISSLYPLGQWALGL